MSVALLPPPSVEILKKKKKKEKKERNIQAEMCVPNHIVLSD